MDEDMPRRIAGLVGINDLNNAESRDFLRRLLRASTQAINLREMA